MSPHGYIDDTGQPRLVLTIPVDDDDRADEIARQGWLDWLADCADPEATTIPSPERRLGHSEGQSAIRSRPSGDLSEDGVGVPAE